MAVRRPSGSPAQDPNGRFKTIHRTYKGRMHAAFHRPLPQGGRRQSRHRRAAENEGHHGWTRVSPRKVSKLCSRFPFSWFVTTHRKLQSKINAVVKALEKQDQLNEATRQVICNSRDMDELNHWVRNFSTFVRETIFSRETGLDQDLSRSLALYIDSRCNEITSYSIQSCWIVKLHSLVGLFLKKKGTDGKGIVLGLVRALQGGEEEDPGSSSQRDRAGRCRSEGSLLGRRRILGRTGQRQSSRPGGRRQRRQGRRPHRCWCRRQRHREHHLHGLAVSINSSPSLVNQSYSNMCPIWKFDRRQDGSESSGPQVDQIEERRQTGRGQGGQVRVLLWLVVRHYHRQTSRRK